MNDLQPIINVLACPTIYGTSPILSMQRGMASLALNYSTLNEEYVIQKRIQDYQDKKKREAALMRVGGAILGGLLGIQDGFQIQDIFAVLAGGAITERITKTIQDFDDNQLRELGLEWVNQPSSYVYHRKRHRGDAIRRLVLIAPEPTTNEPRAAFATQFPDGYVAFLKIIDGLTQPVFTISDGGFNTDWVEERYNLGCLPVDCGMSLAVEFWCNSHGMSVVAIPYRAPHHSMY